MASGLAWVRVVPLVALLWGLPAEVRAELFEQAFVDGKVERLKTVQLQPLSGPIQLSLVKQAGTVKQNEAPQDVLLEVEGALVEGNAQLEDESLYDVRLFDGQAGQIVRITLVSDEFDTFLLLKDASGEELARSDDGSGGSNAEIVFRLPTAGQYQIFANAYSESGRGAYRLTVATSDEAALRRVEMEAEADSLLQQGNDSFRISQYREALESWQSALEIYLELGDPKGEADSLGNLGRVYYSLGEYQRAIDFYQQSLAISQRNDDPKGEADSLGNLGRAYYSLGEYQRAIDFYQQSLAISQRNDDPKGEADSLGNLGNVYYSLGEYQRAIESHQQALLIFRKVRDLSGEARALNSLGLSYYLLEEYEQAIILQQEALVILREIGDLSGEATSLSILGYIYQGLGTYQQAVVPSEYELAINFYQQALTIAREIDDFLTEANSLDSLGLAYNSISEHQTAIDFHQQALTIRSEIGDRQGEANSLDSLGLAYNSISENQTAIDFHQQALTIRREIGDRQGEANSLTYIGIVYNTIGRYLEAIDFYQQALVIARRFNNRESEAKLLNNLGETWVKRNHPEIATIFYKNAVSVYENIRADITDRSQELQESYAATVESTYRSLTDLLLEQGRILEAQQVIELLKVEELREFTRATYTTEGLQYDPVEKPVADDHGSLIDLGADIYACRPNCDQTLYNQQIALEQAFDETVSTFEATIRKNRAEDDVFYDPQGLASDALDIVNAQEGTVLIYPVVLEDTLWLLWTATGGVVGSIEVPSANRAELSRAVVSFRELLTKQDTQSLEDLKQVSQQLHSWLIEPLSEELKKNNIQHLIFAQDRATRYLPMSVLYDGEQFLIENYTVSTVLSAALTDTTDRLGEVSTANILGLGLDQSFPGFSALPNVREELEAVIKTGDDDSGGIYPGAIFMNNDFTFGTLSEQVRRYRILYIATHAEFIPNIKDASCILSGTGEELTIDQIGALDTQFSNLHLVVLSACQTALGGESLDGTEIVGVSSYFLGKNKAEAVLATLWRVDDAGTSLLMQRFYELLATGELTKAEALQQAQLSLLHQEDTLTERFQNLGIERGLANPNPSASSPATLEHPYYWAPFILIGNSL